MSTEFTIEYIFHRPLFLFLRTQLDNLEGCYLLKVLSNSKMSYRLKKKKKIHFSPLDFKQHLFLGFYMITYLLAWQSQNLKSFHSLKRNNEHAFHKINYRGKSFVNYYHMCAKHSKCF